MEILGLYKPIIGMIHIQALPGTPKYNGSVKDIVSSAVKEALAYQECGIDALAIENMHDVPYLKKSAGHEISTLMSIIGYEIKNKTNLPTGMQILAGANIQSLAASHSAGLDFIRTEGFVFSHIADEGTFDSDAGELLRYQKQIGAGNIKIFTDIKKKHSSHSITNDTDIIETAHAAEFFLSDGVIITGSSTGKEADLSEIKNVKVTSKIPVLVGSGVNLDNLKNYFTAADALIIGSYFKKENCWGNELDTDKIELFMKKVNQLR
ncbi:MAG: BtpA/SgcQ family protein [Melioribacteraceae bacterium]|nr:BtpA/SgcQ family protein [Melioribacteraceae bacterium]